MSFYYCRSCGRGSTQTPCKNCGHKTFNTKNMRSFEDQLRVVADGREASLAMNAANEIKSLKETISKMVITGGYSSEYALPLSDLATEMAYKLEGLNRDDIPSFNHSVDKLLSRYYKHESDYEKE